jgi:hypothetical protein
MTHFGVYQISLPCNRVSRQNNKKPINKSSVFSFIKISLLQKSKGIKKIYKLLAFFRYRTYDVFLYSDPKKTVGS